MTNQTTPGVSITTPATAAPIVGVPTGIPVFIGYTESCPSPQPGLVRIASLADYRQSFGAGFRGRFRIRPASGDGDFYTTYGAGYDLVPSIGCRFHLYDSLCLFFANGGRPCYVVSCGAYAGAAIRLADLQIGLAASAEPGPTMVVVPDACQLAAADYRTLTAATLAQCAALQDRVAIFDLGGATDPANFSAAATTVLAADFYAAVAGAPAAASYGTAYHPALKTVINAPSSIDHTLIDLADAETASILTGLLTAEAQRLHHPPSAAFDQAMALVARLGDPAEASFNPALVAALPLMGTIEQAILARLDLAPASGAIAGIWAQTDVTGGVWTAPANVAVAGIQALTIGFTDADQGPLNAPTNGFAINLVRNFPSEGLLVWGARTLDGNSDDFRYISVRRTLIYIEQSVKAALMPYAFMPNDAGTWVSVAASIGNFLQGLWSQGGLMGGKPSDAFSVQCGLGSTMTGEDILAGLMNVSIAVAVTHPAEFVMLTFQQQMQTT